MLICHATHAPFCSWTIPKGLPLQNETYWNAACRELLEETGINISKIKVVEVIELPIQLYSQQKKQIISFLIITNENFRRHQFECKSFVNHQFPEIDQCKWMELQNAKKLVHESQQPQLNFIKKEIMKRIRNKNQKLSG